MEKFVCSGIRPIVKWTTPEPNINYPWPCMSQRFSILNVEFVLHFENTLNVWRLTMHLMKKTASVPDVQVTAHLKEGAGNLVNLGSRLAHSELISWDCSELIATRRTELLTENLFTFVFVFDVVFSDMAMIEKKKLSDDFPKTVITLSPRPNLSTHMEKLLKSGEHADVSLKCQLLRFPAHRCILSARSEVFAAMFRHPMSEAETGVVDMVDIEPHVLAEFLRYLYSGKIGNLTAETAIDLYQVAGKYQVQSLKQKCSCFLVDNLTEDLCYPVLLMADKYDDERLLGETANFIAYARDILRTREWQKFASEHPAIAVKVYKVYHDNENGVCCIHQYQRDIARLASGDKNFITKWF